MTDTVTVASPLQGTIVVIDVHAGAEVRAGQQLMLIESMKMHHSIDATVSGVVGRILVEVGTTVMEGDAVATVDPQDVERAEAAVEEMVDLDRIRPDLAEVVARHEIGLDPARPDMIERRRKVHRRTTRENLADLLDEGSFVEYGPVVIAAQRRRRPVDDLIKRTPADGMVGGIGRVNGELFDGKAAQVVAMSYDYTVLAGTQGTQNHRKKDRLFEVAERLKLPVIFFTEGGGGRPGDTDGIGASGLDCLAFMYWGQLSGLVPLVGINAGYCFAGNAAMLGVCDVVIATADSNIGMGGPAMIEGGGLGVFEPTAIGPMSVQQFNGVVDIAVADEAEAVAVAKQYLSYFQGATADWECIDQRELRHVIPEDRKRSYDVRNAIEGIFDSGSVLELRRDFGLGMVTALARVEGRPVGVVANNPNHLAGAIDSPGADKAAQVHPAVRRVRHPDRHARRHAGDDGRAGRRADRARCATAAGCSSTGPTSPCPWSASILRKSYGLGAQAMMGGTTKAPQACVAWPTGEFGGMGLEGAVRLGYRKELEAVEDPAEREVLFEEMVERMYTHGKALNTASYFEIDDVIDPADTRRWISAILASAPAPLPARRQEAPEHRHLVRRWRRTSYVGEERL